MTTPSRVLVALDCFRLERHTLELAARLASVRGCPMTVLLVESAELCYAAAIPFVREVDRLSATLQPFESSQLERQLERQVIRIESWLTEIRSRLSLPGGLEVERGDYVKTTLATAGSGDLVVFSTRHHWLAVGHRPAVWVWYDGSPESERALEMAFDMARAEGCQLLVAVTGEHLKPALGQVIQITPESWLELLQRQGCTAVFCPRSSAMASQLTEKARCPVLVI